MHRKTKSKVTWRCTVRNKKATMLCDGEPRGYVVQQDGPGPHT